MNILPLAELQSALGYKFVRLDLLSLALTHTSWAHEAHMPEAHNERLEFLGDAVLELCVSACLYAKFLTGREGELTLLRSSLVNTTVLAGLARKFGVAESLKLGVGEERQGGRDRDSILADALEAVLGAVYLDGGFLAAQKVVSCLYSGLWPTQPAERSKDSKTTLQEECQKIFHDCPLYTLLGTSGPDHAREFQVQVRLPDGKTFTANSGSHKKAEHAAALQALEWLRNRS